MARTKQEVRDFLNSLVGQMVNEKCGIYNGQCVSLIKALLEFLGAPNPYAGRGNAKDVGNTLLSQGIAQNGGGWLNVCVNASMGTLYEPTLGKYVNYGHIWLDISNEMNIEQNGSRALRVTKNTRPINQAQQIVNLDQYVIGDNEMKVDANNLKYLYLGIYAEDVPDSKLAEDGLLGWDYDEATQLMLDYANKNGFAYWQVKPQLEAKIAALQAEVAALKAGGAGGVLPAGTYLKIEPANVIEVNKKG